MKAFILSFDYTILKATKLTAFQEQIKKDPSIVSWWHHLKGTYIIITKDNIDASSIQQFFSHYFPNENCLVLKVRYDNYNGMLPQNAWDWMESSLKQVK